MRGAAGGTFADVRLALAYAEYLNPDLAMEVREIVLRDKAAYPTLADDILQRATPEANEGAGNGIAAPLTPSGCRTNLEGRSGGPERPSPI